MPSDGENKKDQPEFLNKIQRMLLHRLAEVANADAREQHTCCPQAGAADLYASKDHAGHAYQGENAYRVRDGLRTLQLEQPLHAGFMPGRRP